MRTSLLVLLLALTLALGNDTLSVLFIGNSHVYTNDLPQMLADLSESAGRVVVKDMSAPGGYALMEHVELPTTIEMIEQGIWDVVALQEQSQIPTIPYWRFEGMYPAARTLDSVIRQHSGRTAFYMTWGWKSGGVMVYREDSSPRFRDYFHMQDSVTVAYNTICDELGARMVPAGSAWSVARHRDTLVDLWQPDECHATVMGTYLAACVFYAALWRADPRGLSYFGGLDSTAAAFCQDVAWETVSAIAEPPAPEGAPGCAPSLARGVLYLPDRTFGSPSPSFNPHPSVLLDACGRWVMELMPGPNDVSCLPPGTYFIAERQRTVSTTGRILILR